MATESQTKKTGGMGGNMRLNEIIPIFEANVNRLAWYHGSPNKFSRFTRRDAINRTNNVAGVYLTNDISTAEDHAGPAGFVYTVSPQIRNTFIQGKTSFDNEKIIKAMMELVPNYHPAYKKDWVERVIVPEMIKYDRFKSDMSGELKQDVLKAAGYDSYLFRDMFEDSLVVFDENKAKIVGTVSVEDMPDAN